MKRIGTSLIGLDRNIKLLIVLLNDIFLALVCWFVFGPPMATFIATGFSTGIFDDVFIQWESFVFPILISITYLYVFGFYKSLIQFFDSKDSILLSFTGALLFGFSWAIIYVSQLKIYTAPFLSVAILQGFLLGAVFYAFLVFSRDVAKYALYTKDRVFDAKNIIIYGTGKEGMEVYNSLQTDPSKNVIAFFDHTKVTENNQINNIPIFGSFDQLQIAKEKYSDLEILLAISNLDAEKRLEIIIQLEQIKVAVRTVPSYSKLIGDQKSLTSIQDLSIDDLLPRYRLSKAEPIHVKNKTVFISGAGGSIGSEIARQLLKNNAKEIILFDISEYNLYSILHSCEIIKSGESLDTEVIPILGDINDLSRLDYLFSNFSIDYIYHAAAYKHVPIVEYKNNITVSCKNNILGTRNLALKAIEYKIQSFVMISSDKAVRPTNVMGASKRLAEMCIQSLNNLQSNTKFSMVRFGNVLNSSGSVIPFFQKQIAEGGPVTITDLKITRYFMTIPEASNLVLQAAELSHGGEVFILDMGDQIKIYDLAKRLIHLSGRNVAAEPGSEGIEIKEIGLRPGEKMYEELLLRGGEVPTSNPKIFKSMEPFPSYSTLEVILQSLETAIGANDHVAIKEILEKNVEGYAVS